jgi:hypothetical protein
VEREEEEEREETGLPATFSIPQLPPRGAIAALSNTDEEEL